MKVEPAFKTPQGRLSGPGDEKLFVLASMFAMSSSVNVMLINSSVVCGTAKGMEVTFSLLKTVE